MKKLLLLIFLLPLFVQAQTTPAQDTTLITPSTAVTPQWRYASVNGYLTLQAFVNGKYYYYPHNKALRGYYGQLGAANNWTANQNNTGYWAGSQFISTSYATAGIAGDHLGGQFRVGNVDNTIFGGLWTYANNNPEWRIGRLPGGNFGEQRWDGTQWVTIWVTSPDGSTSFNNDVTNSGTTTYQQTGTNTTAAISKNGFLYTSPNVTTGILGSGGVATTNRTTGAFSFLGINEFYFSASQNGPKATITPPSSITSDWNYMLPSKSGTFALTSDITGFGKPLRIINRDSTQATNNVTQIELDQNTGIRADQIGTGKVRLSLGSSFKTWKVAGQPNLVAVGDDSVRIEKSKGINLLTDNTSPNKKLTISLDTIRPTSVKVIGQDFAYKSLTEYGASLTFGSGATTPSRTYANLLGQYLNLTPVNYARAGDQAADQQAFIYPLSVTNNGYQVITYSSEGNDVNQYGANTDMQANYRSISMANIAYLSIPDPNKSIGQSAGITYGGTWTNGTYYGGAISKQSTTNGSSATKVINGTRAYIAYTMLDGNTGTASVSIDGGAAIPINCFGQNNSLILTINKGLNYGSGVLRVTGLSAGNHTVIVTVTSATNTNNKVILDWIGGNGNLYPVAGKPTVFAGNVAVQYTGLPNRSTYSAIIASIISDVQSDGLNVFPVNVSDVIHTDVAVSTDLSHPTDFGHYELFTGWKTGIDAANPAAVDNSIRALTDVNVPGNVNTNSILPYYPASGISMLYNSTLTSPSTALQIGPFTTTGSNTNNYGVVIKANPAMTGTPVNWTGFMVENTTTGITGSGTWLLGQFRNNGASRWSVDFTGTTSQTGPLAVTGGAIGTPLYAILANPSQFQHSASNITVGAVTASINYNQTGTNISNVDFLANRTGTNYGTTPGAQKFFSGRISGTEFFYVNTAGTINSASLTASTILKSDASKNIVSASAGTDYALPRTTAFLNSNINLVLNGDYLATTSTLFTGTPPPTAGFLADGSKLITVSATGTAGARISCPSGYTLVGLSGAATPGTGGITIVNGGKVQLAPIGTNAYQYYALSGSVTVN